MTTEVIEKTAQLTLELEEREEKAPRRIFDNARDKKLIAEGTHFYCLGCLVARPVAAKSYDPRYCKNCCDFLEAEAALLPSSQRPQWRPRSSGKGGQNNTGSKR